MSSEANGRLTGRDLLDGLPAASEADVEGQARARSLEVEHDRLRRLLKAMPQPTYEELARRPILAGEPFKL